MPFEKTGPDQYTSPSGRKFDGKQVRMYYAHNGHFPGQPGFANGGGVPMSYAKGSAPQTAHYAAGGPVLGRTRDFIKDTPNQFSDLNDEATPQGVKMRGPMKYESKYGKTGVGGAGEPNPKPAKKSPKDKIKV